MKNRLNFFSLSFYALFFTLLFSLNANSQGPYATDVDLKAAYCLPYINDADESIKKINEKYPTPGLGIDSELKNIQDAGNVLNNKLRSYLLARNQSLNNEAKQEVIAAISSGEKAVVVSNKIRNLCSTQLKSNNLTSSDKFYEQLRICWKNNGYEMLKLEICNNLSFLPY